MRLRADDVTWREIDGDLVVLDLRSSTYLTANASGTVLMRHLTEERTHDELTQALVDAFGIPEQRARQDVHRFVGELGRSGLLETPPSLPPPSTATTSPGTKEVNRCTLSTSRRS